jgi:hypothetical protein
MKRIYSSDGQQSAPAWFVRSAMVIGFVPIVAWAFVSTLFREFGSAFKYAWLEVRINVEDMKRGWNSAR